MTNINGRLEDKNELPSKIRSNLKQITLFIFFLGPLFSRVLSQDLDPRAYARVPVNATVMIPGISYSTGSVVTDPSIALEDLKANFQVASVAAVHSFGFLKKTSQFLVALPYAWGSASATLNGQRESVSRSGFSDIRLRWSVLFRGAPAMTARELMKAPRKTIFGASINVVVPTGQYFNEKLINLGTNRWAFRPELAISHPFGKKWMADFYTGVWFFTNNNSFFPGNAKRAQNPMAAFQGHLSYNVSLKAWIAFDATFYGGGITKVNGVAKDDRQANSRVGLTLVLPTGKMSSLKLAGSTGAIVRAGANFTTFSAGWQYSFYKARPSKK